MRDAETLLSPSWKVCLGAVHLIYKSQYPGFYENNIPEINDLVVVEPFRRKGIGTKLIQTCETFAKEKGYAHIGLGVGLYKDYGSAQRLYPAMGYLPDGMGLMYKNSPVPAGAHAFVDDDLTIYLVKMLGDHKITGFPDVELTTMCMIHDPVCGRVVVQQRCKSWKGISFPGGHVEPGDSLISATVREVKEETGLTVSNLKACGIIHWYNTDTGQRFFVFNFKTDTYRGELVAETDEGKVFWVDIHKLSGMELAEGFRERLPMFFDNQFTEGFGTWNSAETSEMDYI
jgi:8-oxo-dGTP diphosphatase